LHPAAHKRRPSRFRSAGDETTDPVRTFPYRMD
jgi:hypothetical protein